MNSIKGAGLVSFYHRVALRLMQEKSLGRAALYPGHGPPAPLDQLREAHFARFGAYPGRQGR